MEEEKETADCNVLVDLDDTSWLVSLWVFLLSVYNQPALSRSLWINRPFIANTTIFSRVQARASLASLPLSLWSPSSIMQVW